MLVEVANSGINWMEPRDLHVVQMMPVINATAGQSISSKHTGGFNAAFADSRVQFLPDDLTPSTIKAFLTINGGENVGDPSEIRKTR